MAKGKRSPARPPTPQSVKSHTGWVRDTERAMRASNFEPIAKLLFSEMIDHSSEGSRTCWASHGSMAAKLNLSIPTVAKYAGQLCKGKAIRRSGKGRRGTIKYEILDDWVNPVTDALTLRLDKSREAAAARQAKCRAEARAKVTQTVLRPETAMSRNDGLDLSRKHGFDKHLQRTPSEYSSEEGINAYAAAKGRA